MATRAPHFALAAIIVLGCGGSGTAPRCEKSEDCQDGLVCIVPVGGEKGVCSLASYGVTLLAPVEGTKVGAAGVEVKAEVKVTGPGGKPPDKVLVMVDGNGRSELALSGQDGAILSYQGRYTPMAESQVTLWVEARTASGSVPSEAVLLEVDRLPPEFPFGGAAACAAPACLRDEEILVSVQIWDEHLDTLEASLDLDGFAHPVPVLPTGEEGIYHVRLPLGSRPFPRFAGTVTARLRARDTFGNETTIDTRPVPVTRLRWVKDLRSPPNPLQLTGAAVQADGSVVAAGSDARLHFVGADGAEAAAITVGTAGIHSAPSIGPSAVWVGSEDGNLYGREADGTLLTCPSSGQTPGSLFTPAIAGLTPQDEAAYTGGGAGKLYGWNETGGCSSPASTVDAVTTSPLIVGGKVFLATVKAGVSSLRRFSAAGTQEASASLSCGAVAAPLAADSSGALLVACGTGEIKRADKVTLASTILAALSDGAIESIVLLPNGDLVVGTNDHKLHRLTPPASGSGPWTDAWTPVPDLSAAVTGALVAAPTSDGKGAVVYAVTGGGDLHALDSAGAAVWSTAGDTSHPLGSFPLGFPTIAPAQPGRLPTLYVGSGEGKLYAVVVDTDLDPTSPWPKSHRDIRNTSNGDVAGP